jgi:multicomponent Na+:H+ antiporter subunit E
LGASEAHLADGIAGVVWLGVVWLALWGEISVANLLSGLVVAMVLVVVFPIGAPVRQGRFRPLAAMKLTVVFGWALVVSTLEVALLVLRPGSVAIQGIVAVPLHSRSPVVSYAVANVTSLTPGTVTVDIDEPSATLFVHALTGADLGAVRERVERAAVRDGSGRGGGVHRDDHLRTVHRAEGCLR